MKKRSVNPPLRIDLTTHHTMSEGSTIELPLAPQWGERKAPQWGEWKAPQWGEWKAPQWGEWKAPQWGEWKAPQWGEWKAPQWGEWKAPQWGEWKAPQWGEWKAPQWGKWKAPQWGERKAPQWGERKPYLFYLWRVWVRCRLEVMLAADVLLQLVQNVVEFPLQRGHVSIRPRLVTGQGVTLHGDLLVTNNTSATSCELTSIGDNLITITAVVHWQGSNCNQTSISQTFKPLGDTEHTQGMKEMFYLTIHSTYFIYGYMATDIW